MKKISFTLTTLLLTVLTQKPIPPSHPEYHASIPECKDGLYYDKETSQCEKCHHICKTCSGFKLNCNSCSEGYYFDPLVKVHCMKEGPWHEKFHHFEELFKHMHSEKFHFLPIGRLVAWALQMVMMMFIFAFVYIFFFCLCWFSRGVNINQVELDEFFELLMGRDLDEVRKRKREQAKRRYQAMGGSHQFQENPNQVV